MMKTPLPTGVDPKTILFDVTLENGKYRLIYHYDDKRPQAFRHGEPWPAFENLMLGSKVILAMAARIHDLEEELAKR